jgi:hypothetical protein
MRFVLLSVLLLLAAPVEWRKVASTSQATYYVADERTDRDEREVRVWEKTVPLDTEEGREYAAGLVRELEAKGVRKAGQLAYVTSRRRYKCGEGQAAFEQIIYHDRSGRVLDRVSSEKLMRWESPAPDSIGEALMLDACKRPVESQ